MEDNMKNIILKFIQLKGWDLRKQIDGLKDVKFEDNPPRMILNLIKEVEVPSFEIDGVKIPVEVKLEKTKAVIMVNKDTDMPLPEKEKKQDDVEIYYEFSEQAKKIYNIKEALGPQTKPKDAKSEAYEAWKKRHSNMKIHKGE